MTTNCSPSGFTPASNVFQSALTYKNVITAREAHEAVRQANAVYEVTGDERGKIEKDGKDLVTCGVHAYPIDFRDDAFEILNKRFGANLGDEFKAK